MMLASGAQLARYNGGKINLSGCEEMPAARIVLPAGALEGFFVFAGGGMGMTHNDPTTFPRLADPLGWIPARDLLAVAEAAVTVHRDHGNREDRRHARLKYLVAARGAAWLQEELEQRSGARFQARTLPPWRTPGVLGWLARRDGTRWTTCRKPMSFSITKPWWISYRWSSTWSAIRSRCSRPRSG